MAEALPAAFTYEAMEGLVAANFEIVSELLTECDDYMVVSRESAHSLALAEMMVGAVSDNPDRDTFQVGYRAYHFAVSAADMMLPGDVLLKMDVFDQAAQSPDGIKVALIHQADEYLAANPMIDALIGEFMPELARETHAEPLIERIVALVFCMADDAQRYFAIEAQVAAAMHSLDEL